MSSEGEGVAVNTKRGGGRRRGGEYEDGGSSSRAAQQNSQGILRFYTDEAPGFQIGPTTVLACSLMFIGLVVVLHILGKFRS